MTLLDLVLVADGSMVGTGVLALLFAPAPTPRMQYTGRAFAELLSARVLPRWLRAPLRARPPAGVFPQAAAFASDGTDPLTRNVYEPLLVGCGNRFARLRYLQQGNLHIYLLYVLAAVIGGLGWVAFCDGLAR